jgi:hypothetical protein
MSASTITAPVRPLDRSGAYDLRVYDVAEGELETLERVLRELALPMMSDYGMEAVGFWTDQRSSTLYQISRHAGLDVIEGNWNRFHGDPRWQTGLKERRQERVVVKGVKTIFMTGIAGMPPLADAPGA